MRLLIRPIADLEIELDRLLELAAWDLTVGAIVATTAREEARLVLVGVLVGQVVALVA